MCGGLAGLCLAICISFCAHATQPHHREQWVDTVDDEVRGRFSRGDNPVWLWCILLAFAYTLYKFEGCTIHVIWDLPGVPSGTRLKVGQTVFSG